MNVFDVFAGCGGLSLGMQAAGMSVSWAAEWDSNASETFAKAHPDVQLYACDAREIAKGIAAGATGFPRRGDVDVLAGGPPCQGFCQINRHRDVSDERNSLVEVFFELVRVLKPRYVLMENVTGILTLANGAAVKSLMTALQEIGYATSLAILQCGCFGIPQNRWRVFVFASDNQGARHPEFPRPTNVFHSTNFVGMAKWRGNVIAAIPKLRKGLEPGAEELKPELTVYEAISDLPRSLAAHRLDQVSYASHPLSEYQRSMREANMTVVANHLSSKMGELGIERCKHIPSGGGWLDLPERLKPRNLAKFTKRKDSFPSRWGRLAWDAPFSAIVTKPEPFWGRYIHPEEHRVLSVRECARAQSFSDKIEFTGPLTSQFRQVGNAVPPFIARQLGVEIIKANRRKR